MSSLYSIYCIAESLIREHGYYIQKKDTAECPPGGTRAFLAGLAGCSAPITKCIVTALRGETIFLALLGDTGAAVWVLVLEEDAEVAVAAV